MILTVSILGVAQVAVVQAAAAPASESSRHLKRKAAKAKATAQHCAVQHEGDACAVSGGVAKHVPLSREGAPEENGKTKLIFQEPPKYSLPFENDLSPKKTPVGGLVGFEFPF
jgi:hypothetical protein